MKKVLVSCLMVTIFTSVAAAATAPPLPKGYTAWQKSERKLVTEKSSLFYGVHYIYADKKGIKGYQASNKFDEGSTLIVEHFNIKPGTTADEGSKNMIVMMKKDKRQKSTGGWLFAGYGADRKPSGLDPAGTCFGCHQKDAAGRDFVISTIKDFKR